MDRPNLRHFQNGLVVSDRVQACVGGSWVPAILCRREDGSEFWATPDLSKLEAVTDWRDGKEDDQGGQEGGQSAGRVQRGEAPKRQTRNRQGAKSKKP